MEEYLTQISKEPPHNRQAFKEQNIVEFVSKLASEDNSTLRSRYIQDFITLIQEPPKGKEKAKSLDISDYNFIKSLKDDIKSSPATIAQLKVFLFSRINDNSKQQQEYAVNQVQKYCIENADRNTLYDAEKIATLGKDITLILSPLANGNKKIIQSIKDTADIVAREVISIISEGDASVQLKGWQKFLHGTIDKLKGIFVDKKIQNIVRGKGFGSIRQSLDKNWDLKPISKLQTTKTKKDSLLAR